MAAEDGNFYVPQTRAESQQLMLDSLDGIASEGLPDQIIGSIISGIASAIEARELDGIPLDVSSREEVRGIVCAAMGGNDHMRSTQMKLNAYVVGLANTRNPLIL